LFFATFHDVPDVMLPSLQFLLPIETKEMEFTVRHEETKQ
jgi:hypothetical protein